jgi:hypothetical protein
MKERFFRIFFLTKEYSKYAEALKVDYKIPQEAQKCEKDQKGGKRANERESLQRQNEHSRQSANTAFYLSRKKEIDR